MLRYVFWIFSFHLSDNDKLWKQNIPKSVYEKTFCETFPHSQLLFQNGGSILGLHGFLSFKVAIVVVDKFVSCHVLDVMSML